MALGRRRPFNLFRTLDPAAAYDAVAGVDYCRLSGGDAVFWGGEADCGRGACAQGAVECDRDRFGQGAHFGG